jgi:serine protease Do
MESGDGLGTIEFSSVMSGRKIGVMTSSLTKQLGNYFGVEDGNGILISSVTKDGPADKAGLRAGDVIVEVDGKAVKNTVDLVRGIGAKKEGDISLTIVRDRNRQTISVTPDTNKNGDLFKAYEFRTKESN